MQGIQTDFSFKFDRYIRNLDFDFFISRPNGSSQINETTYTSDLLLSGGSIFSKINKKLSLSLNHINLFEVPSSGTKNISVRNPVYDLSLLHSIDNTNYSLKQKLQTGFSSRYWLHSELENEIEDSTSNETQGMYFEIDNRYIKKDSTLLFKLGYRYVDPDFRSAGSQTRRIDYIDGNNNTIYPFYTNMSVPRQPSLFDLVSDEQLYNQDISSLLMAFNPIYSNILPYGDATPNRSGVYLNAKINNSNKLILVKIKTGFYKEIIGQGALEKKKF